MASRAYRLKQGESVPEGVARIARGCIDRALDELRGSTDSTPEEAVHEARKDLKKLRALLRLARAELGDGVYRHENTCFRDAARELAGVRDADVLLATLDSLEERYPQELPADAAGGLRQALEAHKRAATTGVRAEAAGAVVELLAQARKRVARWPLDRDRFEALGPRLKRTYRRGRRDFRAARRDPSVEHLHEWRKRVKDLWYHCSILEGAWKPVMAVLGDEAHELSDRLGDDHDLAMLLAWAHEHATALGGMERVLGFEEIVTRRRAELQEEAFAYGARLYADKPGAFTRRVEAWWRARERAAADAQSVA
jgi:CHAD domain-containing protein